MRPKYETEIGLDFRLVGDNEVKTIDEKSE